MLEVARNGRLALALRIAAAVICPPLLACAYYVAHAGIWYALLLAYAPTAAGALGLMSRPVLDAALQRRAPRYEFSGKGAIAGSTAAFLLVVAFAPQHVDRTVLSALFVASGLVYYAVGKCGCYFLGCCRAVETRAVGVPLPLIETLGSLALAIVALAAAAAPFGARLTLLACVVAGMLVLRLYSRYARGATVFASLRQLDSLVLSSLLACTLVARFVFGGSLR